MKNWAPTPVTISVLNAGIDADLNLGATYKLKTDHIAESTGAHGIVTDNLLAPAVGATIAAGQVLKTDHVAETTGAHGIVTDNLLAPAVGATIAAGQVLKSDHIAETTGAHGVVHDSKITADHIGETTGAHGVTLDNATDTHHQLTGLTDDDHARYFDKDCSKAMTGVQIHRNTNGSCIQVYGGEKAGVTGAMIEVNGKDNVGVEGWIRFHSCNAAKTGWTTICRMVGCLDSPVLDMLTHNIANCPNVAVTGMIMLWSGAIAAIPTGWHLCDGGAGTPDLRDKFVVGAGTTYAVGATGGEATHVLSVAELAAHTHGISDGVAVSAAGANRAGPAAADNWQSASAGSNAAHENRPPYYALAYIMKT